MAVSEATSLWDLISGGPGKREGVRRDEVRNLLQQLPTSAAAALGPLLTSSDPRQQAFGQQQLQEFQRRRSPEAQQGLELGRAQQVGQELTNRVREYQLQAAPAELELAQMQPQLARNQEQREAQKTAAYIANLNYDAAIKETGLAIKAQTAGIKNEGGLRKEFQSAPVVAKAVQALTSYQQLDAALEQDNFIALQSAIVAIAQVQEPGLAVRNDDRIAYTGNNSVITNMVNAYNRAISGASVDPNFKQNLLALGTQLAGVHASNYLRTQAAYRELAAGTPGANPDRVTAGVGIDQDLVQFLDAVTRPARIGGPGGR